MLGSKKELYHYLNDIRHQRCNLFVEIKPYPKWSLTEANWWCFTQCSNKGCSAANYL